MKNFLAILFFLSSISPVFSCSCFPSNFCDYYESSLDNETSLMFMGSYLNEEEINDWTKAFQFKVEKIYQGEIVTETSIHYTGETYVNTDSTVWLLSGSDVSCLRYLDNTSAIFIVNYNVNWFGEDQDVGYVPTICASDYFPISSTNEVTGWIWESQDETIALEEFETFLEQGCETTSTTNDFKQISVYPNPVTDILSIKCTPQCTITNIELYDIRGILIKKSNETSMDMNMLHSGVYFVKVYGQHSNYIEKVIKV